LEPIILKELDVEQLRVECQAVDFTCQTSAELSPLDDIVGQKRALRALQFGLEIPN
jgi:hypothetical protein